MTIHLKKLRVSQSDKVVRAPERAQVAALCYRERRKKGRQVLLITSRGTGRWILPKGWPIKGLDAPGAAKQEAWEEAGVKGRISDDPLGSFRYKKRLDDGSQAVCEAQVFPMQVAELADDFPESDERERKWVSPGKAAKMVSEPALKDILRDFED